VDTKRVEPPHGAPASLRIDCVTRTDRVSPHHRIRAVGGTGRDGEEWRLGEAATIAAIENERATFHVERPDGTHVAVVVGQGLDKTYLRAESDTEAPDALLALPDCD
jgi:hypothetical protein